MPVLKNVSIYFCMKKSTLNTGNKNFKKIYQLTKVIIHEFQKHKNTEKDHLDTKTLFTGLFVQQKQ